MADAIEFYFDVISPYVYIAHARLQALAARRPSLSIAYRPVLFAGVLNHWGQRGPAEIGPKREFTFKDIVRRSAELGLPLRGVASHPFNPLLALRTLLATPAADRGRAAGAVLHAGWGEGGELSDPAVIRSALDAAGLPGADLVARAADPAIKAALQVETELAIGRGVFGVPTYVVGSELLWGQDRVVDVEAVLDGRDPVRPEMVAELLARPASANRR